MKPRAFVGSSVEGLHIAYAVQQNLLHDVEVTVWDQGVFELSATTIESLTRAIENTDFGIFVFSPDDVLRMREAQTSSVRDNVLFEFGLFIGKLGRERVFYLVPSSSPPHIPSDLLGITPAKYESERADGSMQAATGPACHQMRQQMKRLGSIDPPQVAISAPGELEKSESDKRDWIVEFIAGKYNEAKAMLEASLSDKSGDDALEIRTLMGYCDFKLDDKHGMEQLLAFAAAHNKSPLVQRRTALILATERETDRAIELLKSVDASIQDSPIIKTALAYCYVQSEQHDEAIEVLNAPETRADPDAALALADIHEEQGSLDVALGVVHDAYISNPRHRGLRYKYARLAQELEQHTVAVYFLDALTAEAHEAIEYWGYLGNSCLSLDLYDRALYAYRRAEGLIESNTTEEWIISNIGNLFNNKGLFSEGITYLTRGLEMDPASEYAHARLATALKQQAEELKTYKKKVAEGLRVVRETQRTRQLAAANTQDSPADEAPSP